MWCHCSLQDNSFAACERLHTSFKPLLWHGSYVSEQVFVSTAVCDFMRNGFNVVIYHMLLTFTPDTQGLLCLGMPLQL